MLLLELLQPGDLGLKAVLSFGKLGQHGRAVLLELRGLHCPSLLELRLHPVRFRVSRSQNPVCPAPADSVSSLAWAWLDAVSWSASVCAAVTIEVASALASSRSSSALRAAISSSRAAARVPSPALAPCSSVVNVRPPAGW